MTSTFDVFPDGRRKSITYPGSPSGLTIDYDYLATGDLRTIKQGADALATYSYDNLGNRTGTSVEVISGICRRGALRRLTTTLWQKVLSYCEPIWFVMMDERVGKGSRAFERWQ